nr:hypothetical protein [Tanacetum cinerariifolium]
ESIMEREKHKREYDNRMNERQMPSKEGNIDSSKALDVDLVVTKISGTESEKHDTSSRSENVTHAEDADIKPVNSNITSDSTNMSHMGGEIDHNAEKFTPCYFPKVREYVLAKPHHVIAPGSSRNSSKESYGSNDMVHNYYLEEAKKKTKDENRNLKPRKMPSARTHHTSNACTPKPRSNNQTPKNCLASKSSEETLKAMQKADHSRNPSSFLDSKYFVCSTCQKCVINANHDVCITKFLKKVNSHVKVQSRKTRNSNKPVEPKIHTQKPGRQIVTGHRSSPNKSFDVHEKAKTPRSCLRWIPTGRIFYIVGLRWVPTGKKFTSSITKVDCEPPNSLNEDITNPYEYDQTLNVSAGTLNLNSVQEAASPRAEVLADSPVSISISHDASSTSIPSSQEQEHSPIISQAVEESPKTLTFHDDPLNESSQDSNFSRIII